MQKRIIHKRLRALEAKSLEPVADEVENGNALDEIFRAFEEHQRTDKPMPPRRPIDPNHPMAAMLAVFDRE